MLQPAIAILDSQRTMAISTLRADGWPQTTIVGYSNEGWTVYFLILRSSQKFENIRRDDRVSFAVSDNATRLSDHQAVYSSAHAIEVTDQRGREHGWRLLVDRHPNLADFEMPDPTVTAMMRAVCEHVSVLDNRIALGHTEALTVHADGTVTAEAPRTDRWRPFPD